MRIVNTSLKQGQTSRSTFSLLSVCKHIQRYIWRRHTISDFQICGSPRCIRANWDPGGNRYQTYGVGEILNLNVSFKTFFFLVLSNEFYQRKLVSPIAIAIIVLPSSTDFELPMLVTIMPPTLDTNPKIPETP